MPLFSLHGPHVFHSMTVDTPAEGVVKQNLSNPGSFHGTL